MDNEKLSNNDNEDGVVSLEDFTKEQLIDIIHSMQEQQTINTDEINYCKINIEEFYKGVKLGSLYGGLFISLISCGMDSEQAYNVVLNQNTLDGNLKSSKLNNLNNEKNTL